MRVKIVSLVLVLVVSFTLTTCTEEPSVEEVISGVSEAMSNVTSYQFDMDMTMDVSGEEGGEPFGMSTTMDCNGALDTANKRMRMDMIISLDTSGEDEFDINMDMEMGTYVIDDTAYIMTDMLGMGPTWVRYEISAADWAEMSGEIDLTESYLELLELAQVRVSDSESIDGIDCYALELTPDIEQLWQTVMQQAQVTGEEMMPDFGEADFEEIFRQFSVKLWVAKDTYFMTKAEILMTMEATPEDLGYPEEEGEMNMDIILTLLAYDHNQPVSIILPPEAEEASEMPFP